MNFNTTLGKGLKTAIWLGISAAITAFASYVTQNPDLFNPGTVTVVNIGLVLVKNFVDPRVDNI